MEKSKYLNTAEEYQSSGEEHYKLAVDMEDRDESQKKIDACWRFVAKDFWQALTLGSKKAPIWLFKCFRQGVGVEKDPYIRDIMYGAALKLTPQDAKNIKDANKPVISKSMQPRIDVLVKLVEDTHAKIPAEGVTMEKLLDQMDKFNHAIKLPSGKLIQSCFTERNTQDASKTKELKSQALELTKHLPNHNKTTMATKDHHSRKTNKTISRKTFGIL
ncbi:MULTISPECIES: hypothetical protein [unclassified Candidatus Tisiphia]|uniref:hypothetical protein n=1 Tax=unclassified Candidatus Tisiphia TaxID=2996318 RepID=UPI00312CC255